VVYKVLRAEKKILVQGNPTYLLYNKFHLIYIVISLILMYLFNNIML
jgi:hypothetical protein